MSIKKSYRYIFIKLKGYVIDQGTNSLLHILRFFRGF